MSDFKTEKLTEKIIAYLKLNQSVELLGHTLRTVDYALELNREMNLGIDEEKVAIAALLHDLAKEYPYDKCRDIAHKHHFQFDELTKQNPHLMHASIAALEAKNLFGVEDEEILRAVASHTTGSENMGDLELLIYVADKIEPAREFPKIDKFRKSVRKNFHKGCLEILQHSIKFIKSKGKTPHPDTLAAIRTLKEKTGQATSNKEKESPDASESDSAITGNEKVQYIKSLVSIDAYIVVCTIIAIFLTFLASTLFGLFVMYKSVGSGKPGEVFSGKYPTAYYFNGRNELLFLVAGLDNVQNVSRTDTLILAKLDFSRQKVKMISFPRDTYVKIPGSKRDYWDRVNAAYTSGGEERLVGTFWNLTGHHPDYLVMIDYAAFINMVDLVGGVEIDVEKNMHYDDYAGNLHIHLDKGIQVLNGDQALGYVRYRQDADGDFSRMRRQQYFAKQFLKALRKPQNLLRVRSIIVAMLDSFEIKSIDSSVDPPVIADHKFKVIQYMAFEKYLRNLSDENLSANTLPIAQEGTVDHKAVLIPDYTEFDITMQNLFDP